MDIVLVNHCFNESRLKAQGSRLKAKSDLKIQSASERAQSSVLSPRYLFLFLIPLLFALCALPLPAAYAASVDLEWDSNTEPELAGYKIYWGTSSGNYGSSKDVGKTTIYTIAGLDEGQTYYFAATAYDGSKNESGYSNQVSFTVPFSDSDGTAFRIIRMHSRRIRQRPLIPTVTVSATMPIQMMTATKCRIPGKTGMALIP